MPTLLRAMANAYRRRWQNWLQRRHPRGMQAVTLSQKRVYIFLSPSGVLFAAVVLAMLGGAINYDLALAYVLVFLLAAMANASILHTFRNLLGLTLAPGRVEACHAGEAARFEIVLDNSGRLARHNLRLFYDAAEAACDVAAGDSARVWLSLPAPQRGWLRAPRLRIETHWPLGVFRAWSYGYFDQRALVYPAPEVDPPGLPLAAAGSGQGLTTARGQDDFSGLRPFQRGDSPRHIAWKAAAREDGLLVKEFHGEAALSLWLAWDALPSGMPVEARLSRLTAWVLQAHAAGFAFGLSLPGREHPPASGEAQRDACLASLALYGLADPGDPA
ncbi:DUF58 domain-containing protein [Chitinimonas sp.]|uniref:DUF58 domain-containing protein n=1 Tax=Chitinimonas sp. TaxID=1934313 RepID=UPI0035B20C71